MSTELETLGAASAGGLSSGMKADLSGQPCRNCGTMVEGRYCPNCGQLAASLHRPFVSLIAEVVADTTSLDGRLARTLPRLMFRPGVLTRDYTDGKRGRYVPPFRLFLLASLIFYVILFGVIDRSGWLAPERIANPETGEVSISIGGSGETETLIDRDGKVDRDLARRALAGETEDEDADFLIDGVSDVVENPELFVAQLEQWLPRLSFLALPITIFALMVLNIWRRSLYVYDHAIHALHLQSWFYLMGSVFLLIGPLIGAGTAWTIFGIALYAYVWRSLVIAGRTNFIMGFIRLNILLFIWFILAILIIVGGVIISGLAVSSR